MSVKFEVETYTVCEVAAMLGVGKTTLYEAIAAGNCKHLAPIRVGQRVAFPRRVIDRLLVREPEAGVVGV